MNRNNQMLVHPLRRLAQLLPAIVAIAFWQAIAHYRPGLSFFIGSPTLYWAALVQQLKAGTVIYSHTFGSGALLIDIAVTGGEALVGFAIGNIVGATVGLWMSRNDTLATVVKPYVVVLGTAPLFAFAPIIILCFGIDLRSKVIIAALSTLFVALMQAFKGAREVDKSLVQVAQSFGASRRQVFLKIVVPSSTVWVVNAFRLNVGFALLGAFLGEFITSSHGLGHLILVAQGLQNVPLALVGVSMISLLGLALTWAMDALETPIKHFLAKAF